MQVGLIGSGNMARAMARGWGEPVLCTDSGSGRAAALAAELGGEALASNAELAERAELVVLCHKPAQLDAVAGELAGRARAVASVLGATPVAALQAAYPDTPVFALMPNTPVEVRAGVICYSPAPGVDSELERSVLELFGRLGTVVTLPERLMGPATATAGVGPAYFALVVEAQVDAAVRRGLPAAQAATLAVQTMAGAAALLAARGGDTLTVRREVTSPGGSTARGLAALERRGLRTAFQEALDAVIDGAGR
ncbi:MAG: pyrroline-5-carboxylate reductase [Solirubrobacteraceae bacterium]|jgi:pyrroline-5-carboxylate reductase|nr:pyrroline-5-carboxylate reductase [Solirubrobacteraceae bacterium]